MTRHLVIRETREEFVFDPKGLLDTFHVEWHAWEGSFDDFVLDLFERHNGSMFGDELFYDTAGTDVGCEVVARGDDE